MPSRKATHLTKSAMYVESTVEKNDEIVDQALADRYTSLLQDGETMPDFKLIMRLIQRDVAGSRLSVAATDVANLEELADDEEVRRRKNELTGFIVNRLNRWRGMFDRAYGPGRGLELAGMEAETADDLVGILRQGQRVVGRCRQQVERGFGKPDIKGVQLLPQEIVDDLDPVCKELDGLTAQLNLEERERQATQIAKDATLDSHVETFTPSAQVLQGFFLLAGFPELAAKVKPSSRRPGRREVETDQGGGDDGENPPDQGDVQASTEDGSPDDAGGVSSGPPDPGPPDPETTAA